jgi:hypothetical protein
MTKGEFESMGDQEKVAMVVMPWDHYKIENFHNLCSRMISIMNALKEKGYLMVDEHITGPWPKPEEAKQDGITNVMFYVLSRDLDTLSKCNTLAVPHEAKWDPYADILIKAAQYCHGTILKEDKSGSWHIDNP